MKFQNSLWLLIWIASLSSQAARIVRQDSEEEDYYYDNIVEFEVCPGTNKNKTFCFNFSSGKVDLILMF